MKLQLHLPINKELRVEPHCPIIGLPTFPPPNPCKIHRSDDKRLTTPHTVNAIRVPSNLWTFTTTFARNALLALSSFGKAIDCAAAALLRDSGFFLLQIAISRNVDQPPSLQTHRRR